MSALGQKQTCALQNRMSALPPIATAKADFGKPSCLLYPQKRTCAVQLGMSGDELTLVDTFRYKTRMPSRAAAVRELLKRGLAAEGFAEAAFGSKSSEYGVSGAKPEGRKK